MSPSGQPTNSMPVDVEIATLHPAASLSRGLSSPKLHGFHMIGVSDENVEGRDGNHELAFELESVQTAQSSVGEYRVYRRRWAGLLVLMAMNIVTSWGVRFGKLFIDGGQGADLWNAVAHVRACQRLFPGVFWVIFHDSNKLALHCGVLCICCDFSVSLSFIVVSNSSILIFQLRFVIHILNKRGVRVALWMSSLLTIGGFWVRYIGVKIGHGTFGLVMLGQILIGFAQPFVLNTPTYYSDLWFTSNARVSATALASLANPFGAAIGQLVNPSLATKASEIPQMILITALIV